MYIHWESRLTIQPIKSGVFVSISFFGFSVTPAKLTILRNPDEVLPKVVPCFFNIC